MQTGLSLRKQLAGLMSTPLTMNNVVIKQTSSKFINRCFLTAWWNMLQQVGSGADVQTAVDEFVGTANAAAAN